MSSIGTKGFHNALQGQPTELEEHGKDAYLRNNEHCAAMLAPDAFDAIIVHDPQPAAIRRFLPRQQTAWVWRCHIDSSQPDPRVWAFLCPFVESYDTAIFTMREFVPAEPEPTAAQRR